jgi:MFS family permease
LDSYLDRNALPNARIQGIETDLKLQGEEFNSAISVLFVGYIALQVPSNLILTRVRPSIYLPACMGLWGLVSASTAFVKSFFGLAATRFFLGFLEAPFFPGALFLLSSWYTKEELATRMAVLYAGSLLSSAFGGLFAAAIQYALNGFLGMRSWQWLFVIEGCATILLSVSAAFVLPDFPSTTRWLSDDEKVIAVQRLEASRGTKPTQRSSLLSGLHMTVTDYKVWILAAIIMTKTSAAAVGSFVPTLIATLEYGRVKSLLLVAPPYIFAAIVQLGISFSSDKMRERYCHLVLPLAVGMVGFIMAAIFSSLGLRYLTLFLILGGIYGGFNVAIAWVSSTVSLLLPGTT